MVIEPTPGRVVWYYPGPSESLEVNGPHPLAAIVTEVQSSRSVNLCVFDSCGGTNPRRVVTLRQPDDARAEVSGGAYCEWMPYQVNQVEKRQSIEQELARRVMPVVGAVEWSEIAPPVADPVSEQPAEVADPAPIEQVTKEPS